MNRARTGGPAQGREIGGPRRIGSVAPLDPVPRRGGSASLIARTLTAPWVGHPPRRLRGGGWVRSTRNLVEAAREIRFDELPSAFDALLKGQARGRYVVKIQ